MPKLAAEDVSEPATFVQRIPKDRLRLIGEFQQMFLRPFWSCSLTASLGQSLSRWAWRGCEISQLRPHVEEDGILCLTTADAAHHPIEDAKDALNNGYKLVSQICKRCRGMTQSEFLSYSDHHPTTKGLPYTSLSSGCAFAPNCGVAWR